MHVTHLSLGKHAASQVSSGGSTFYASGYADGNKDGWVMMQTVSGVTDDGQEVVAVVAPGKYPPGSSVLVEARHVVGKPKGLDWDRAAMLPFLVRVARSWLCLPSFRTPWASAV